MIITALSMVMFIVCVGLVVDVGHAMLVQRQLQAGSDAAALAAAYELPNQANALSVGAQFSPTPGMKNGVNTVNNATTNVQVVCMAGVPGCNRRDGGVNAVVVQSQSKVPTWFGRIIGLNTLTVNAKATACAPCVVKPLDVMVVLDRNGLDVLPLQRCGRAGRRPSGLHRHAERQGRHQDVRAATSTRRSTRSASRSHRRSSTNPGSPTAPNTAATKGYEPWTGTPNPNVASGPLRNIDGQYFGYDAYWPYWVTWGTRTPSRYVVASLEGADGNAGRRLHRQRPGARLDPQPAVCLQPAPGLCRGRGRDVVRAGARRGAARARHQRPRKRPGRHHLHLRRRSEHMAEQHPHRRGQRPAASAG